MKRGPKGDPNPQKGPLGDPGTLKGTHCGTVRLGTKIILKRLPNIYYLLLKRKNRVRWRLWVEPVYFSHISLLGGICNGKMGILPSWHNSPRAHVLSPLAGP